MTDTIDRIDMAAIETPELEELARRITDELGRRRQAQEPEMRRIICRAKRLNARGNGEQETRRIRLPDGQHGWASDLAEDVEGSWGSGTFLAADRKCGERGMVTAGTIVLAFDTGMRGGQKTGRAQLSGGVVLTREEQGEERSKIRWGLSTRRRNGGIEVQTPAGEWVVV